MELREMMPVASLPLAHVEIVTSSPAQAADLVHSKCEGNKTQYFPPLTLRSPPRKMLLRKRSHVPRDATGGEVAEEPRGCLWLLEYGLCLSLNVALVSVANGPGRDQK